MDLGIAGRTAIVNGASVGLGAASARALAREGVDLVISARGEDRLLATAEAIAAETGVSVTPVAADHSTDEGRERILAACPNPDILVGTCSPPPWGFDYRDVTPEVWHQYLAEGMVGPAEFIRRTVDGMAERGFGRIINIATGAAKFPNPVRVLSGPPRSALANYSVAVSKVVAADGVTINTLLPGFHHTAAAREQFGAIAEKKGTSYDDEAAFAAEKYGIPAGEFGDPDDFGAVCAMLCSAHAGYITGQSLVVDGGVTVGLF
ncbi:MAG: SDR family oxidoreductase [Acidimicrobiales bacterium]|jgi:3-oxoacyl-[acyl-carrier protein] reductase|nr:SDR family oxidoreductase [Acidimicrobiales bacterium]